MYELENTLWSWLFLLIILMSILFVFDRAWKVKEESGGWFKKQFDELDNDGLDFLEFVEDIQTDWLDELC